MASTIYSDSGLAAVTFWNGDMRLYFQDTEGFIVEAVYESGKWTRANRINPKAKARLGSPLAAVTWGAATNRSVLPQIRVFYQSDQTNTLSERIYGQDNSGLWVPGNLQSLGIKFISLAACMVADADIRLYYTDSTSNTDIVELATNDVSWRYTRSVIPTGKNLSGGTSLAAIAWKDNAGAHVRIYYCTNASQTAETAFDADLGWIETSGAQVGYSAACKQIAAVNWGTTDPNIRTYTMYYPIKGQVMVAEQGYSTTGWSGPAFPTSAWMKKPNQPGAVAAVTWNTASSGRELHVFMTGTNDAVGEARYSGASKAWTYAAIPVSLIKAA